MADQNRVALITGGAKRVGRAIAIHLARNGFDVAFTYRSSKAEAVSLEKEIKSIHRRVLSIEADLFSPQAAADHIFRTFSTEFNRLDLLVNNASVYQAARLSDTTGELVRKVMTVHVESPLLLAKAFAPVLRAARGHIVNMSDLLAERPWPEYLAYCASKAALSNLTLGLARELAPEVTVNAIAPGVVEWPDDYPEAEKQKYLKRVALGRDGTPEDVAATVHFLATGGSYITGQIIRLDGGRSIT